jgi:hypothetical protein
MNMISYVVYKVCGRVPIWLMPLHTILLLPISSIKTENYINKRPLEHSSEAIRGENGNSVN